MFKGVLLTDDWLLFIDKFKCIDKCIDKYQNKITLIDDVGEFSWCNIHRLKSELTPFKAITLSESILSKWF